MPPVVSRGLARIEERVEPGSTPEMLHHLGLLRLAEGRSDEAVLSLEAAANRAPRSAAIHSDLSAALLARARAEDRPLDLLRALDSANRAEAADPRLLEALYNRAEALTRLYLRGQARRAWDAYLDVDPSSPWSGEARRHQRELSEPTLAEQWERELPTLESAVLRGDSRAVQEIVSRFPQAARLYAEEKALPAWAAAFKAGDMGKAANRLALARQIGVALATASRDEMIGDSVAIIDHAAAAGPAARLAELAQGHAAFGQAMELYYVQKLTEAQRLLASAAETLGRAASPFRGWADFYVAVCDHYSVPEQAVHEFLVLQKRTNSLVYPVLAGRAEWMLGTITNNLGQPERALQHYRRAFALLDSSVGPQFSSFVHVLFAECYTRLGETSQAWRERLAALATIGLSGDPRRVHAALQEATDDLVLQSMAGPALDFGEELRRNAESWGNPTALAEAYLQRGRALHQLGYAAEALQSLRIAGAHAQVIRPSGLKDKVTGTLAIAEAEGLSNSDPKRAVEILSGALATQMRNGYDFQLTQILTARARIYTELGDDRQAESDLLQAIEEHERTRGGIREERFRVSSFERAQEDFDEMIHLQAGRSSNPARALEFAERSRSRALLDLVLREAGEKPGEDPRPPRSLPVDEILSRLPESVRLIEYAILRDRLLIWVLGRGSLDMVEVDVSREELAKQVDDFRNTIERRGSTAEIRLASASLYNRLVRPVAAQIPQGTPLIFVPDRFLARVPFAALVDAQSGRYLIEDRDIALAPSATLYLTALDRLSQQPVGRPRSALVVGNPSFDRQRYPQLPRLAEADAEATEIAALYPEAELLLGQRATTTAFLTGAREHELIHFAGHSLLDVGSPRVSRLLFAPGPAADSGTLYAYQIAQESLERTRIVVLSACSSLDSDRGGRESVTGLAAGFLAAGPPVVVAGLWQADDRATRALMRDFHTALRGGDPARALRFAQLRALAAADADLRSPALWAGFEVIGGLIPTTYQEKE